ncbi:MAG TPA: response regulator transcription factor [Polyangia bacterium]|jgi:DNA-binding NarL/FixJ family response regulator|nr:response regulator transcription factor [Polyangia bacterium]
MKRILVVDDSLALRGSLRALLAAEFPDAIVGEAAAALPALALVAEEGWDLVLLDLSLPDRGGVETLRDLRKLRPNLPVVVMSLHGEAEYRAAMCAAGAVDYISKGGSSQAIAASIRTALGSG